MNLGIAAILTAVLLTACATHSNNVTVVKPTIRRIAIIPAANPSWYSFQNAAPPPPLAYPMQFWVNKFDSKSKAKIFNDRLHSPHGVLGDDFTQEVAAELRDYGFSVEILQGIQRPLGNPDDVDYDKITTDADAILHLWIEEVGVYSSPMSAQYIPRVNIGCKLWPKGQEASIYEETIYYGVDAKAGKKWAIVPDAKYAYPNFDAVLSHIDEIQTALSAGTLEISKKMTEQIYSAAK
jgi:hypothetical protein